LHLFPWGKERERKDDGAMSLFSRLLQAVDSWRLRRGGPKTAKRAGTAVEQLDHRRLLSVNFTGNVPVDFPATESPGVAIISNNVNFAPIGANLQPIVFTSGFNIKDIRVTYTPSDDTLSVGLDGPPAGPSTTSEVIAGDADDNGNSGTVNPAVLAIDPNFMDFPDFGGSEFLGVSLDFTGSGTPQVVAGFPATAPVGASAKTYEVALAGIAPGNFGTPLPQFVGNVYTVNSPSNPNLEFSITHFSELYQQETGQALTTGSTIEIGGFGGSGSDGNIGEASIGPGPFTIGSATPVTPPVNPPPSPPILINPHEHRIIDTGHRDLVRVSIFGTSGFPVSQINPATVELDGVASIAHITRKIQRDEFPFQTYVFVADQLNLPPGLTPATLTGKTFSGVSFESQKDVLNLPHSALAFGKLKKYMGNATYYERLAKIEASNPSIANTASATTVSLASRNSKAKGAAAIVVDYTPKVSAAGNSSKAESVKVRPVVSLKRAEAEAAKSGVPTRVRYSMEHHLSAAG
jgi:hypothetical protein